MTIIMNTLPPELVIRVGDHLAWADLVALARSSHKLQHILFRGLKRRGAHLVRAAEALGAYQVFPLFNFFPYIGKPIVFRQVKALSCPRWFEQNGSPAIKTWLAKQRYYGRAQPHIRSSYESSLRSRQMSKQYSR